MFSKQEAIQLRKEFWINFGRAFPRKWILYDTKIKDLAFKFEMDVKKATVAIEITMKDELFRNAYFEKFQSLESILKENTGVDFLWGEHYFLDNGKEISRIWTELDGPSIYRKETWPEAYRFFVQIMSGIEETYIEFEEFIKDV